MAQDQKGMVPGVSTETLGECLRHELSRAFGRPVEKFTSSDKREVYREIARTLLTRARLRIPVRRVVGTIRIDEGEVWIEPRDGSPDVFLVTFGRDGDVVEIIQVEPER